MSTPDDDLSASSHPDGDDAAPPPVEGGRIAGTVTDFGGNALVGVRVEVGASGGADLDLLPVMTDGEGRFVLEGLGEGRYDLRFALGQVRARTLAVPVGTEDLRVKLARPQGILLVVKTAEGHPPPDLLHVKLEREGRHGPAWEYTGRHLTTRMLLWKIRPATYTLTVWGGGWLPVEARGIEVREKRPAPEVEILLSAKGGGIRGRVLDAAGAPATSALVAWRRLDAVGPWPRQECAADADETGRFQVTGLPAGRYLVSAGREHGPFVDVEVAVEEERATEVDLCLP